MQHTGHASADKPGVERICQLLEDRGIACWIAPRDVTPGSDYAESIIRAIEGAATTILFLSGQANASIHIKNEVERATSKRKRVIPVRLEDTRPAPALELHLASAHWMEAWKLTPDQIAAQLAAAIRGEHTTPAKTPTTPKPDSDSHPIKIVPKGLRSFDANDADFFLELLPGPRDRDCLPDSIRFWMTRIEETDAEATFRVGLIYGPSGCGKSSLVKAGLLPRLSPNTIAVYVEATAEETETRLLNGNCGKRCSIKLEPVRLRHRRAKVVEHDPLRHPAEVPERVLQATHEALGRLPIDDLAVRLPRVAQHDAKDMRPPTRSVRLQHRRARPEIHLRFFTRTALHPAKRQFELRSEPTHEPTHAVVAAGEAVLRDQVRIVRWALKPKASIDFRSCLATAHSR